MSVWIEARRVLFDDDEQILIADHVYQTKPLKLAGKITVQPAKQFVCFNSFREGSCRRKDNISRLHTWVIEFDEKPLDEQRKLWADSDMPRSLLVYSGGKSIHCYIRTLEDVSPEQWLDIANALHRIYPDADPRVLKGRSAFSRLPGGMRDGTEQEIETRKERVPLQTLLKWIESNDVTKYIETKGHRDIGIKGYSKISPPLPPSGVGMPAKIQAERTARETAFQELPPDARPNTKRLFKKLVCNRYKAAPGQRNDLLVQMMTFLHDAVCEQTAMLFASEFWKWNQTAWKDSLEQHMIQARAHWSTLHRDYPNRLTEPEREIYSALDERQQTFFRICRSLAHDDNPPEGDLSFFIPMQRFGDRMQLYGEQVSRLIDDFIRWSVLTRIRKGTQTKQINGNIQRGKAGVYRWVFSGDVSA